LKKHFKLLYLKQNNFSLNEENERMNKTQQATKHIIDYISERNLSKGDSLPTLREIASACGVSLFIAKKAIEALKQHNIVDSVWGSGNFVKDLSKDTLKNALTAIEHPPSQAMNTLKNSNYIVFMGKGRTPAAYGGYLRGIYEVTTKENSHLIMELSNHSRENEIENINRILENKDIGGIIINSAYKNEPPPYLSNLKQRGFPHIFVGDSDFGEGSQENYVTCDNSSGFLDVMNFLYDMGHRYIAYVGTPRFDLPANQERYNTYKTFLANKKLPELYLAGTGGEPYEELISEIRDTQCLQNKITAFACCGDALAKQVIDSCRLLNLKVPADVSVTGFDSREWTPYCTPSLTSVFYPTEEIGRIAAEELFIRIKDPLANIPDSTRVKPRLIIRGSVKKINSSS